METIAMSFNRWTNHLWYIIQQFLKTEVYSYKKRHGEHLNAYFYVKEAGLKGLHTIQFYSCSILKKAKWQTGRSWAGDGAEEGGQENSVRYCNGGTQHAFVNTRNNVQHKAWAPNYAFRLMHISAASSIFTHVPH